LRVISSDGKRGRKRVEEGGPCRLPPPSSRVRRRRCERIGSRRKGREGKGKRRSAPYTLRRHSTPFSEEKEEEEEKEGRERRRLLLYSSSLKSGVLSAE